MKISIIGCGVIGSTLAKHLAPRHALTLYDKEHCRAKELAACTNTVATENPIDAIKESEIVILAVKPQFLHEVADELAHHFQQDQLLISVLMGTPLAKLRECFPAPSLLRIMPNTPMIYGAGVIGIVNDHSMNQKQKEMIEDLFSALGLITWVSEEKIDAITALASSTPAYLFILIEAMIDAGIYLGFPSSEAQKLVLQTVEGSLKMLLQSGKSPSELKWEVASPGGSTIGGILELEKQGIRGAMMQTILAGFDKIPKKSS